MSEPRTRVAIVYVPPAGSRPRDVRVLGETTDWRNGVTMIARDDGAFVGELELPVGVYAYKLLVDGAYIVDPASARTSSQEGTTNGLLVIGGADEPFVFAPAPPYVVGTAAGVRVLVGVRRHVWREAQSVTAYFARDSEDSPSPMLLGPAFETDDLLYFSGDMPWIARRFLVSLETGAHRVGPFRGARPPAHDGPPEHWQDAVLYTVLVDRFRPEIDPSRAAIYQSTRAPLGGHLEGIIRSLDELADLGVDTLVLTPVHVGESSHRYDFVDPLEVCPKLGGRAAFAKLVSHAHERGLRVIVDLAFSHAGAAYPPAADVLTHGAASPHAPMFQFSNDEPPRLLHYGKRDDAPLVNLDHPTAHALVLSAVRLWADLGVDGLRLDMTAELPPALGKAIRDLFRQKNPSGVVFGEVVPLHAWRYQSLGMIDASTDFSYFEAARAFFAEQKGTLGDLVRAVVSGDLKRGGDPRTTSIRFLSTHDHPRFASLAARTRDEFLVAWLFTVFLPGVPMLLYGEEIGLRSLEPPAEAEDVWPDRMPMVFDGPLRDEARRAGVKSMLALRRAHPALRRGTFEWLHVDEDLAIARRRHEDDVVDLLVSTSDVPRDIDLEDDALPSARLALALGGATLDGTTVTLPGRSAAVLVRSARDEARKRSPRVRRNLALVDDDMSHGRALALARPSRIDFAVTEACNLACVHCITFAPQKTRDRSFRTLSAATLDAIREDLSYAKYFGFVHGGESLTSEMTFRVLEAIRDAKGHEPYVAHVLTNGLLLDVPCANRLWDLGVTSLSISLDGACAATNDGIRVGGRFDEVVRNVATVVAAREETNRDVRIGLSLVVMKENVHELWDFMDLARKLGVDWVKLEELVPVTPRAARSLLTRPSFGPLVAAARARGEELGLRVVDHTNDAMVFLCEASPEERAFVAADAFANRNDDLHPCRSSWETACLDPDGTVHLGDFFGPILGRVGERSMASLWNEPAAQEARARFVHSRPCGHGPASCLAP